MTSTGEVQYRVSMFRLYIAGLHYNENSGRSQAMTSTGEVQYRVSMFRLYIAGLHYNENTGRS